MAFLKKLEKFETHHKVAAFFAIMVLTVVVARIGPLVYNPNPVFLHLELHHFDYGVLLLILTSLLFLFGKKSSGLHLVLAAIATGFIIDEYWFIRRNVVENAPGVSLGYVSTFSSVIVFATFIALLVFFVDALRKK